MDNQLVYNQFYSTMVTLFPGMSNKTYQDVITNIIDFKPVILTINKINQSLLDNRIAIISSLKNDLENIMSRDYLDDKLYDVSGWILYASSIDIWDVDAFSALCHSSLFTLTTIGGLLGWDENYILTVWSTNIISMLDDFAKNYRWNIEDWQNYINTKVVRPTVDFIYQHTTSLRAYLTTVVGTDIGNLDVITDRVDELDVKIEANKNIAHNESYSFFVRNRATIWALQQDEIPPIKERIEKLESDSENNATQIVESLNTNTESIEKIDTLLESPVSSFYNYKETNNELYLEELQVFAKIFQDVLDLGYISIQGDIEKNLERIIRGVS